MSSLHRIIPFVPALLATATLFLFPAWWCGLDADDWFDGDLELQRGLAEELVAFEASDDAVRHDKDRSADRFVGEWALVTHQMTALGLAQLCFSHPKWKDRYRKVVTAAATKSFLPEMRRFGTRAWHGEDALASLGSSHGHAYLAYAALAVGMARLLDPSFPKNIARRHDALIAAYERRLLASPTGLIETYPGEAYPTDVAAVAAAIAVHGRATQTDHKKVLRHWADNVRRVQIDEKSGLIIQRMNAKTGGRSDAPRGSGTGLAAYFAGFADRALAAQLTVALDKHVSTFFGFGAIREYAEGYDGSGDIDSGPVVFGVAVSATGFALAPFRAFGYREAFRRIYRTVDLFGLLRDESGSGDAPPRSRFATGGPIGNALLLALLTYPKEALP